MRKIVYVHGVLPYSAGFSDSWFAALKPYTGAYGAGILGETRLEVVWSSVVNHSNSGDYLYDFFHDFESYLNNDAIRQKVIAKFTDVVGPELDAGNTLDVCAHSWGAVVSYEGLRALGEDPGGDVLNYFTPGSALARQYVLRRLLPANQDGKKPGAVVDWYNLCTSCDIIGGTMRGPYQITDEYLGMAAMGCGQLQISCCHEAYFDPKNVAIQQTFARLINASV